MRRLDDTLPNALNRINTQDASCAQVFNQLVSSFSQRDRTIETCIQVMDKHANDANQARKAEFAVQRRWVRNERQVEDILQTRSLMLFQDKCGRVFRLPEEYQRRIDRA